MRTNWRCLMVGLGIVLSCAPLLRGQTAGLAPDQSNDQFGYFFHDRSSAWQSFTAGMNGHLAAVQVYVYSTNGISWTATLEIRKGEGASGTLLASQTVTGDSVNQQRTFVLATPVRQTAGDLYTFVFRNASTAITVRATANNYAAGRCHHGSYDYNFKTWVLASDWAEEEWRDTAFTSSSSVIGTAAQLAQFAWLVNNGITFAGQTITLAADIDLGAHYWVPAGSQTIRFAGTFNGAGYTVRGIYIDRPESDYQGLFGSTGADSVVQNLTVTSLDIVAASYAGGVVGHSYGVVTNCSAYGRMIGTYMVGGVAGCAEGALLACVNHAEVSGLNGVGGVVGMARGGTSYCSNSGAVSGANDVGGVVGYAAADVTSCANSGKVTATEGERTGGVAGSCGGDIFDCRNSGNVSGSATVGGIVGDAADGAVDRCSNSGSVSGATAGGIAAITGGAVRNCVNSGAIGIIEDGYQAGGIVGYVWGEAASVMNCANSGTVSGANNWNSVGGLVGWNDGSTIANCVNSGAVSGSGTLGGLVGRNESLSTLSNSYWKQINAAPFTLDAVGFNLGTVTTCHAFGTTPGTLAVPVTVDGITTDSLSEALNAWMAMTRDNAHLPLRRWTRGSSTAYPTLIAGNWSDVGNYSTDWYSAASTRFQINTAAELAGLAVLANAGYIFYNKQITLTDHIDLSEHEWTPIGSLSATGSPAGFDAIFNGNGKSVSGVYVDQHSNCAAAGFFGAIDDVFVFNLAVVDADVAGKLHAGALFGYLDFGWAINNSCSGRVSGDYRTGGLAGTIIQGVTGNCWSDVRVSGAITGGLVGHVSESNESLTYSYWKRTGEAPFNLPAAGNLPDGALHECHTFGAAPGNLALPPGQKPSTLAETLNEFVIELGPAVERNLFGIGLYGWSSGTTTAYPVMVPLLRVNGEYAEEPFSAAFAHGTTLSEAAALVTAYTNVHANATVAELSALLSQADLLGFRLGELAQGSAILDFAPTLRVTAFDPVSTTLSFELENGIDAHPAQALVRLGASTSGRVTVLRMATPGGDATPLATVVQYAADHGTATFTPETSFDTSFFKLSVVPVE